LPEEVGDALGHERVSLVAALNILRMQQ
jgi:hypothetical protein